MNKTITLPNIGDIADVEVIEVAVSPGDPIKKEDPLITLESDKAAMDIPSPETGKLVELLVQVGGQKSLKVITSPLLKLLTNQRPQNLQILFLKRHKEKQEEQTANTQEAAPSTETTKPPLATPPDNKPHTTATHGMPHAGPAVRKLARKLGVDFKAKSAALVPHRRILKEDVQSFVKAKLTQSGNASGLPLNLPPRPNIDFSQFGDIETEELSKINILTGQKHSSLLGSAFPMSPSLMKRIFLTLKPFAKA